MAERSLTSSSTSTKQEFLSYRKRLSVFDVVIKDETVSNANIGIFGIY